MDGQQAIICGGRALPSRPSNGFSARSRRRSGPAFARERVGPQRAVKLDQVRERSRGDGGFLAARGVERALGDEAGEEALDPLAIARIGQPRGVGRGGACWRAPRRAARRSCRAPRARRTPRGTRVWIAFS